MMGLRPFAHEQKKDADLAKTLESHLEQEKYTNSAHGLYQDEARRQAHLKFGNAHTTRERVWGDRSSVWIEDVWRDLRFALRSLTKTRAFTAVSIVVIAAGIGANTGVFSVINTVLLKPLS
jgi:putative ABC transport system permease protein